jgi:site-specific recombinase XerD
MKHPDNVWTELSNSEYPLPVLLETYIRHLGGRTKPASPATIDKYKRTLNHFMKSLELNGDQAILANLTPFTIERYVGDCRAGRIPREDGMPTRRSTEDSIGSRLAALKAFTHKYVYRNLGMTTRDLLERVERYEPIPPVKDGLTKEQLNTILDSYEDDVYDHVRDRAMIAFYASSGLRFDEVLSLTVSMADPYSGWTKTIGKGNVERVVQITDRACAYLRTYLRQRVSKDGIEALWTTRLGKPLSYWGGQMVFRRLKQRSGISIIHAHRFRHTWTQTALTKGAERALVQDQMGWRSDAMVRRYGGWARSRTAAASMPQFAPL